MATALVIIWPPFFSLTVFLRRSLSTSPFMFVNQSHQITSGKGFFKTACLMCLSLLLKLRLIPAQVTTHVNGFHIRLVLPDVFHQFEPIFSAHRDIRND